MAQLGREVLVILSSILSSEKSAIYKLGAMPIAYTGNWDQLGIGVML